MTSDINTRASWDANCLKIEALAIAGPQTLRKLHGQAGDSMTVQWVAKSPFPLKNREYLMQRDLATLPPARAGGTGSFGSTCTSSARPMVAKSPP